MRNELIQTELDEIKRTLSVLASQLSDIAEINATGDDEHTISQMPNDYYTDTLLKYSTTDLIVDNKIQKLEITLTNKIDSMQTGIMSEISKIRESMPEKPNYVHLYVAACLGTIIAIIPVYTKNEWNDNVKELKNTIIDSLGQDFINKLSEDSTNIIKNDLELYKKETNEYIDTMIYERVNSK
jgi:hypothetical protein